MGQRGLLQEQLLDMAGSLTCLWEDMSKKEAIILIQRVLVLLGSASHSIEQERRRIAWSRINLSTVNSVLQEDTEENKMENTLFDNSFVEGAAKRLEEEKALAKVTGARLGGNSPSKYQQYPNDSKTFFGERCLCKVWWQDVGWII